MLYGKPSLSGTACDQYFCFPAPQPAKQIGQSRSVFLIQQRGNFRPFDSGGGFEIIPYDNIRCPAQQVAQIRKFLFHLHCCAVKIIYLCQQIIDDRLRRMDFPEIKPKNLFKKTARILQPAQITAGQCRLSDTGLSVQQKRRLFLKLHGPFQFEKIPSSADKPIFLHVTYRFRQTLRI